MLFSNHRNECVSRINSAIAHENESLNLSGLTFGNLPEQLLEAVMVRNLDLSFNRIAVPSWLTEMRWLESLNLSGNVCVDEMLKEIDKMSGLHTLSLTDLVVPPTHLPRKFGQLKRLTQLSIDASAFLEFPDILSELSALTSLTLTGVRSELDDVFRVIAHLPLTSLSLHFVSEEEQTLPESLSSLTELEHLDLSGNPSLTDLPSGIAALKKLRSLELQCVSAESAGAMVTLPSAITELDQLEHLDLRGQRKLRQLPEGMDQLSRLTSLRLEGSGLTEFPSLSPEQLMQLKCLTSHGPLPELARCPHLSRLEIVDMGVASPKKDAALARSLSTLTPLPELTTFVSVGFDLGRPDFLLKFPHLRTLTVVGEVSSLPEEIGQLKDLESISLHFARKLRALPEGITTLTHLRRLVIDSCALTTLPEAIAGLAELESLLLTNLDEFKTLSLPLSAWKKLQELTISSCPALSRINCSGEHLSQVPHLSVSACPELV